MARLTRFKGLCATDDGYYVGKKNSETALGTPYVVSFSSASTAQTVYVISPVAGVLTAGYLCADTASIVAVYTVKAGSAGVVMASATQTSGVAGVVSTMTLGTVAVTAGMSISVARGVQGTTAASTVTLNILQTA